MEKFPINNEEEIEKKDSLKDLVSLRHVIGDIDHYWEIVNDMNALPLDVDPAAKYGAELLENQKSEYARILFDKMKETEGEEKLEYAQTLNRLIMLLGSDSKRQVLEELMTTEEAIKETINQTWKKVKSQKSMTGQLKMQMKKAINHLLGSSDEV